MKVPERKETVQSPTDYLQEQITYLAEDIMDLNEDVDLLDEDIKGIASWSDGFVDNYNNMLDSVNYNFDILDRRTKETIDKHNNVAEDVSNLNFNATLGWGLLILNLIFTLLLMFHVL